MWEWHNKRRLCYCSNRKGQPTIHPTSEWHKEGNTKMERVFHIDLKKGTHISLRFSNSCLGCQTVAFASTRCHYAAISQFFIASTVLSMNHETVMHFVKSVLPHLIDVEALLCSWCINCCFTLLNITSLLPFARFVYLCVYFQIQFI